MIPFVQENVLLQNKRQDEADVQEPKDKKQKLNDDQTVGPKFMSRKPDHLKLELPPSRQFICDEVELTERERKR